MSSPDAPGTAIDGNRAHWDLLAGSHAAGTGRFYDTEALARGDDPLWAVERAALVLAAPTGVTGLDVLHHQCHLASDGIRFALEGARVTGLDLSPRSIAIADERARRCGVELRLVVAEAAAPPEALDGAFDLVWATIGVTCWALDLDRWAGAVHRMLKPGGRLVLVDLHPVYNMLDSVDPLVADLAHGGGQQLEHETDSSYNDPGATIEPSRATVAAWSLGEHIGAVRRAGLVVEHLEEHLECEHDPRGLLTAEDDGLYRLRLGPGQPPLPILFTLVATRADDLPSSG